MRPLITCRFLATYDPAAVSDLAVCPAPEEGCCDGCGYTLEEFLSDGKVRVWIRTCAEKMTAIKADARFEWIEDVPDESIDPSS